MKDLEKLIEQLKKEVNKHQDYSIKSKQDVDKAYNDGASNGILVAIKAIEKTNNIMNEKVKALL